MNNLDSDQQLDVSGALCPLPLLKLKLALRDMAEGQTILLIATDRTSQTDIPAFCKISGNELLHSEEVCNSYRFWVRK